ncbi:MAG: KpsF/GutQ family sugar-phosphate isomerase [Elusimicrobiota bacterium]|jgi:arabinose-5-phosphate isomerase|nr:KpsF/GutQ family sugar-phosphate isomerase [Elusimicrobiota bacterium]
MNIQKILKSVFEKEIQTLNNVKDNIDVFYEKVIKLIFESKGKLIIVGVGKSGLIAKKIVATLISTGTPAFFLHPTEALHGDFGIVSKDDVIIAISKSGNSKEIVDIIPIVKRFGAKVIALTANKNSKLAEKADYILYMPINDEACPFNLVPTCSTTATLVIGDAIAIALMKLKNFNLDDFAIFHPGGELGKKLTLKVSDIMRVGENNAFININDSIEKMFIELSRKMVGAVAVVDENDFLKGIITDFDIRKIFQQKKNIYSLSIADIMNKKPLFVYSDEMAYDAIEFMKNRKKPISVVLVLDKKSKKFVGILHIHDIIG